jgi:dihydroorotate dehydrogenase electron transfer subunit
MSSGGEISGASWAEAGHTDQRKIADLDSTVKANSAVYQEYRHLILNTTVPALLAAPGQFFNLACSKVFDGDPLLRRPMSMYKADPILGTVEFLYKVTGPGTQGLAALHPGDKIRIFGPLGQGFRIAPHWRHIVVLGRGVGLATLAPLAEMAYSAGTHVTAILSARYEGALMSVDRFKNIGASVHIVLDSDGTSTVGNVEYTLRRLVGQGLADAFFTCGSNRLMLLMQKIAEEFNIPGQVALEQQMACGLGMCFCCVRHFKCQGFIESRRVCIQGPVFDLRETLTW